MKVLRWCRKYAQRRSEMKERKCCNFLACVLKDILRAFYKTRGLASAICVTANGAFQQFSHGSKFSITKASFPATLATCSASFRFM